MNYFLSRNVARDIFFWVLLRGAIQAAAILGWDKNWSPQEKRQAKSELKYLYLIFAGAYLFLSFTEWHLLGDPRYIQAVHDASTILIIEALIVLPINIFQLIREKDRRNVLAIWFAFDLCFLGLFMWIFLTHP